MILIVKVSQLLRIDRLKQLRESKGWTQRDLSRACNIADSMIHRYENGLTDPTTKPLSIIAEKLEVSVDYLLGLTNNPRGQFSYSDLSVEEDQIVQAYRREGWPGLLRLGADQMVQTTK